MKPILYQAFLYLTYFIQGVLIGRIILSWFRVPALSRLTDLLYHLTEPILAPLRVVVDHSIFGERRGGITVDISPLIAFMILDFLRHYVEMIFFMLVNRLFELSQKAYNYNMPVFTEFLDLNELKIAGNSGIHKEPVLVIYSSYFKDDERRIVGFFPNDYIEMDSEALQSMLPITVFQVTPSFESKIKFSHRDLLGTLLGLGLERRLIGDILVFEDRAFVQCLNRVSDIIKDELRQVKHQSVYLESVGLKTVNMLSPKAEELVITVASERLDVIIKGLTNQSRTNASAIVQRGDVKVNQVEMSKIHASIEVGDIISIRRYGKYKITQIQETKKAVDFD